MYNSDILFPNEDKNNEMISQWSFTRLLDFEDCPAKAFKKYVEKIPEPERVLPEGEEHPLDRGARIHQEAEDYVRGLRENLPREFEKNHGYELKAVRELFEKKQALVEDRWGFDKDWNRVDWFDKNVWGRIVIDANILASRDHAIVVDYKTGKRKWNEIKHGQQMQLYQLVEFEFFPKVETVDTELWYVDLSANEAVYSMRFTRKQGERFKKGFEERAFAMTTATEFPTTPSKKACRFCPYRKKESGGTGDCKDAEM